MRKYLIIFVVFISCNIKPNEITKFNVVNGDTISFGTVRNGLQEGKWCYFKEDGLIKAQGYFLNGSPKGKWLFYLDKNMSVMEYNLDGSKVNGFVIKHSCSGDTLDMKYYKNGFLREEYVRQSDGSFVILMYPESNIHITCFEYNLLEQP